MCGVAASSSHQLRNLFVSESEIGCACLKMASTSPTPPARSFSVVSEKALDDLDRCEALLREYTRQIDEVEAQLQRGAH